MHQLVPCQHRVWKGFLTVQCILLRGAFLRSDKSAYNYLPP